MKITAKDLCGKKIGFFGMGGSNASLLRVLPLRDCEIILRSDTKINRNGLPKELVAYKIYDGANSLSNITEDIIFLSPSVRRDRRELQTAANRGVLLSSDAELFFENNSSPLYAITGSDGKSTTATLTSLLLGKRIKAQLIGNIGEPMFASLSRECDAYVTELSSFMLTYHVPHTKRAAVTNITPNHLDWHDSFEEYAGTKLSLLNNSDEPVICYDDPLLKNEARLAFAITSAHLSFSELRKISKAEVYITYEHGDVLKNGEKLLADSDIKRKEIYNVKNLMTAIAMTDGSVSAEDIREVASTFCGLTHRCEYVGRFFGVDYYDSSIDSTPARTKETLRSLGKPAVIILGGRSKGVSYSVLCDVLKDYAECAVITGENSSEIHKAIKNHTRTVVVDDFDEAVEFAARLAEGCGTVLLSPASTSYDRFSSYKERGEHFKRAVKKYRS